jgi:PEGA domain
MRAWKDCFKVSVIFLLLGCIGRAAPAQSGAAVPEPGTGYTVTGAESPPARGGPGGAKSAQDEASTAVEMQNRRALEQRAGGQAGKMLLRSVPSRARIFVDGAFVGRTPLLLLVAPGQYDVQMRGEQEQLGERTVTMAAGGTEQIALTLAPHYPTQVTTHLAAK